MSKRNELYSLMKLALRPKRYDLNAPFYHRLDDLFLRRFPDTPLPQRRRVELKKIFDENIVLPPFVAEENNKNFSIKTNDSESITTNKISEDIINYIVSVADPSEKAHNDTQREALEQERVFLNIGEILNKVFLLFKYLRDDKGIKCHAVENIIKLETPFREATLLMCMTAGKRSGRAGKVIVFCPQKAIAKLTLDHLKKSDDNTINNYFSILNPALISEEATDKIHGIRCYKLAFTIFNGAVIASNDFNLEYKIGNKERTGKSYPLYLDALRIIFLRRKYNATDFRLVNLYSKEANDKRIKQKIKAINTMFKSLQETDRTPSLKSEINKVVDWSKPLDQEEKDKYVYRVLLAHKHFFMFSVGDPVLKMVSLESLQP